MKILTLSDTHGTLPELNLEGIDVVLHAGDFSFKAKNDFIGQLVYFNNEFCPWVEKILARGVKFFFTYGNHETYVEAMHISSTYNSITKECLLVAGYHTVYQNLVFTGLQYTNRYGNWAFNENDDGPGMGRVCNMISPDTNILLTHGPVYGFCDELRSGNYVERLGSKQLLHRVEKIKPAGKLKAVVCGHIHSAFGRNRWDDIQFVNCSLMDESYNLVNNPVLLEI